MAPPILGRIFRNHITDTPTTTSVVSAASDTPLLTANTARQGATIFNGADKTLYLLLGGGVASASNYTCAMVTLSYYEVPAGYTGAIRGCWASGPTGNCLITELA